MKGEKMNLELITMGCFSLAILMIMGLMMYNRKAQDNTNTLTEVKIESVRNVANANGDNINSLTAKVASLETFETQQREVNDEIAKTHDQITKTFKNVISEITTNREDIRAIGERDIVVTLLPPTTTQKVEITNLNPNTRTVSQSRLIKSKTGTVRETISIKKPHRRKVHPEIIKSKKIMQVMDL